MQTSGSSRLRSTLIGVAGAALALSTAGAAAAGTADPLEPHTTFTMQPDGSSGLTASGAEIPNIDSDKSTIRTYYAATNGIADKTSSPYISEMRDIEADVLAQLPAVDPADHQAVVFDADDTTLWTYDMEDGAMKFTFDPVLQNHWVQDGLFPATPGMVDLVNEVAARGYHVYGITGRTNDQEAATLDNLADVGYLPFDADNFFTKWTAQPGGTPLPKPDYVDCTADGSAATSCSTVEYKAFTRRHIQDDLGDHIVLNVGDQFSDLQGGFADASVKLPNPTYYLPSPNIAGAPSSDATLTPRTEFTMAPDGSSGRTEGGEGIPNIDSVKSTIRTYYRATNGIAAKDSSPYISEMQDLSRTWSADLATECTRARKADERPAVVFDADDTTLWTYDMEDGAMKFTFDPALQNTWVQDERFPATPGMVAVVRAADRAGCTIVGLTGRNDTQRSATLGNLAKFYVDARSGRPLFRSKYYFTKWTSGSTPPAYVDCSTDGNPASCSTIDYKASTRAYVEDQLGFSIVANFGDQFSDLIGGHGGTAVKLPNPTYYLP